MIHYAFSFCQAIEDNQELPESLLEATKRLSKSMPLDLLLKSRDSLRELAGVIEDIAVRRS